MEKAPFLSVGDGCVSEEPRARAVGWAMFPWRRVDCTEQQYFCGARMSNQQEGTGDRNLSE